VVTVNNYNVYEANQCTWIKVQIDYCGEGGVVGTLSARRDESRGCAVSKWIKDN